MKKLAITLSEDQLRAIEAIRRKKRVPRSRVIQHAVSQYLAIQTEFGAAREYEEGYRHQPETAADVEVYAAATSAVLVREEWE